MPRRVLATVTKIEGDDTDEVFVEALAVDGYDVEPGELLGMLAQAAEVLIAQD